MLALMLLALPFLLLFAIGYMRDLRERQGEGAENCDNKGQIFTYVVHKSETEILTELDEGCAYTDLKYRWNAATREINLHEGMPNGCPEVTYHVEPLPQPDGTALCVRQLTHLRSMQGEPGHEYRHGGNRYAWLMNEFWRQKLGAEPMGDYPEMRKQIKRDIQS